MSEFDERVLRTIRKFNMISFGDCIVVAVSGGPDSMSLLRALIKLREKFNIKLVVAHVNHMIRAVADSETEFVKGFCEDNGVDCFVKRIDVVGLSEKLKISCEEAAWIDGCSRLKSFFHVIIHVAKPGLFVTALFCFMTSWDEYMYASIFINTTSKKTIQVGMQDFVGQYSVDWGLLMSAVVISLIPILIFFALVQKNLVQGLSAGAVKG